MTTLIERNKAIIKKRNKSKKKGLTSKRKRSIFDCDTPKLRTVGFYKESISEAEGQRQRYIGANGKLPQKKTERSLSLYAYVKPKFSSIKKPKLGQKNIFDLCLKAGYIGKVVKKI